MAAAILAGMLLALAGAGLAGDEDLRPAALAGTWYPGDPQALGASVDAWLRSGRPTQPLGAVKAVVTPHAGHRYSGSTAGAAWAAAGAMDPSPSTVILVGPSHHFALPTPGIWPAGAFATPLGPVPVNQDLAGSLSRRLGAGPARQAHLREHCLEVQTPFIRRALPQASIVPVLTGGPGLAAARDLGLALAEAARGGSVLLAASTDLSHFHDLARAQALDAAVARRVQALDPEGLLEDAAQGRSEACGLQALAAVMFAARELGANRGVVLAQTTSAAAGGGSSNVVGYLAAALVAGEEASPAAPAAPGGLDPARQARLRQLAAQAVTAAVKGLPLPSPPQDDPALLRPAGVFVTLKKNRELRGCIGTALPRQALARAVVEMAAQAALKDPRFPPVRPDELMGLELELSVLSPFEPCAPEQVRVGVDGLMIEARGRSGLLLPQVPGDMGWDRDQYLRGICQKAGLPAAAWREPGVRLYRFQAQVF